MLFNPIFQDLYRLTVSDYHGTSGDGLFFQNGMAFTTIDNDNDLLEDVNCATMFKGAWWYSNCHYSNLNGFNYGTSNSIPQATGITWTSFTTEYHTLKWDLMAIRPAMYDLP